MVRETTKNKNLKNKSVTKKVADKLSNSKGNKPTTKPIIKNTDYSVKNANLNSSRKNDSHEIFAQTKPLSRKIDSIIKHKSAFRYFKLSLVILPVVIVLVYMLAFAVRNSLLSKIDERQTLSDTAIMARSVQLKVGSDINKLRVLERLKHLEYTQVRSRPKNSGEYQFDQDLLSIFMRATKMPDGETQPERLYELAIVDGIVTQIVDTKYYSEILYLFLEPELLSYYDGSHVVRASTAIPLDEFPKQLVNAILSVEDERFYKHFGVDPISIVRASIVNLKKGGIRQGGSTITQQLVKNVLFTNERSFSRKILEIFCAVLVELTLSKDKILELYLNEIFLGQEGITAIHGFGEASLAFFEKNVADLTIAEDATLAGIIKAPSNYSPRRYPERAKERREIVLAKMKELNFITDVEFAEASKADLVVNTQQRYLRVAPYFLDYVRKDIETKFGRLKSKSHSIKIYTGIDLDYQNCAQVAVEKGLANLGKSFGRLKKLKNFQAILLGVSTKDRQIRSYVGGRDYSKNQFERIHMALRQPGSTFKPFVYLTALDSYLNNYKAAKTTNILMDEPVSVPIIGGYWEPKNFDNDFKGEVTVREALTKSLNIPAVELSQKTGLDSIVQTATLFGIGDNLLAVPSIVLGSTEVTPLALTRAYLGIANYGEMNNILPYYLIADEKIPFYIAKSEPKQVANPAAVFVLIDMLRSVIEHGTGHGVRRGGFTAPAAGKTGTTNDSRDAWFVGFTPTHLATVWVGTDDNKQIGLSGGQAAVPIWTEYMKCISAFETKEDFTVPEGVVFRKIDPFTGLLWNQNCDSENPVTEVFVSGTEPGIYCDNNDFLREERERKLREEEEERRREEQQRQDSWWGKLWE